MCRKRVSEHVRTERSTQPCLFGVGLQDFPEADTREAGATALRVDEKSRTAPLAEQSRAGFSEVLPNPNSGFITDRYKPLLVSLSCACQVGRFGIDVGRPKRNQFGHTHSRCVQ